MIWLRRALIFGISIFLSGCSSLEEIDLWESVGLGENKTTSQSAPERGLKGRLASGPGNGHELRLGDRFTFDNPRTTWEISNISNGRIVWRTDSGEIHVTDANPILPALEWSGGKGGAGRRLIRDKTGSLFPMRVGAKTTFRSTVTTDRPPFGWENIWTCTVQGSETLQRLGRSFETFIVGCGRKQSNEMTFNYAPTIGHYILQRTYQGVGKPEKVRNLIAYERGVDRTVSAAAARPLAPKKSALKATQKPAAKPGPRVSKRQTGALMAPPQSKAPLTESGGLTRLMDSVIVQTPNFGENAVGAGKPAPFKPTVFSGDQSSPAVTKPLTKKTAKVARVKTPISPLSVKSGVKLKTRRRIPVPGFAPLENSHPQLVAPPLQNIAGPSPPMKTVVIPPVPDLPAARPPASSPLAPPPPGTSVRTAQDKPQALQSRVSPPPGLPLPVPPRPGSQAPKVRMTQVKPPAPPPPVPPAPSVENRYGVHLASYRSEAMALRGWRILSQKSHGLLMSRAPLTRKVSVKDKGEFYRLYIGPLMAKDDARTLCESLKIQKIECNVSALGLVKPG